jgi:hypothetical protein
MEWTQDHRIGIRDIDEQHQAIVQRISRIEQAVAQYDGHAAAVAVVRLSVWPRVTKTAEA